MLLSKMLLRFSQRSKSVLSLWLITSIKFLSLFFIFIPPYLLLLWLNYYWTQFQDHVSFLRINLTFPRGWQGTFVPFSWKLEEVILRLHLYNLILTISLSLRQNKKWSSYCLVSIFLEYLIWYIHFKVLF